MKKFDNDEFKKSMGLYERYIQPYDYDRYKTVNPNLTKEAYEYLRANGMEWKILCGLSVYTHYRREILKEVWWLKQYKETDFYKYRYAPKFYLQLDSW